MSYAWPETSGAPPRFVHAPPSKRSGADEAIKLAKHAGLILDPWQAEGLRVALAEDDAGRCASFEVGTVCPRQNGKNAIAEAAELHWLFLDDSVELITHTAHRFDTSLEHFRRMDLLISTTPDLAAQVKHTSRTNGKEGFELRNGKRLRFAARSKAGGRGFSGDRVVLDEAFYLNDLGALIPTMSARPDPQLWWMSSAPVPGPESNILRSWIARGRDGDGVTYLEWSAPEDTDPDDRAACAAANPGYGVRLDPAFVWDVERKVMSDEEFLRERMGVFPDPTTSLDWSTIDETTWTARTSSVATGEQWMRDPVSFGVYVAADQSYSAIAAAGDCVNGGRCVELVDFAPRTEWLVERLARLCERHETSWVALNPKTAAGVFQGQLAERGVPVKECAGGDEQRAHGGFFAELLAGGVSHPGDEILTTAARKAEPRKIGDSWVWNTRGSVAVLPLAAASLALWAAKLPPRVPVDVAASVW
jgi:hypothetical protein